MVAAVATVLLLVGATVVGLLAGEIVEAIAVLVVLVVNAIVGVLPSFALLGLALVPLAAVQTWRVVRAGPGDAAGSGQDGTGARK